MDTGKVINKISNRLRRRSVALQEKLGMSGAQGNILNYILVDGRKRSVYQKDIEKEFGLRPSTATEALKNLEAKGLLIRRDAPSDRRSQLLYPTKKAESLRSSKAEIEAAFYEYLTNVLTAEEAAAFAAALNKLYTASKTESRAGFPHFRKAAGGEAAHEKG